VTKVIKKTSCADQLCIQVLKFFRLDLVSIYSPKPFSSSGNDRILPHTAMSDVLLVMVMAPFLLLGAEA
jgi:hypothetical protein